MVVEAVEVMMKIMMISTMEKTVLLVPNTILVVIAVVVVAVVVVVVAINLIAQPTERQRHVL